MPISYRTALRPICVILCAASTLEARGQDARRIAQSTFPSVVLLIMEDANGQPLSLGSGFFVREGVIATNEHVIEGADHGYAKLVAQKEKYQIAETIALDELHDVALLKAIGAVAPSLRLGDSSQVTVGDEVYAVGNPEGLEGTFSQGIISGVRKVGPDSLLQITAPISPGSSGGPVLNARGEVIGMAAASFRGGQNLNFAIPVHYLKALLSNTNAPSPFPKRRRNANAQSILGRIGAPHTEAVVAGQLTWDSEDIVAEYSFSLRNNLREPVKDIHFLVVFYDRTGKPIDSRDETYIPVIPPGAAKRIESLAVSLSVRRLTASYHVRVLNFQIGE